MSDSGQDEKFEEKRHEKSVDEKWRSDPLGAIVWALILIWAGLALLLGSAGLLDDADIDGWQLAFTGAGAILLLEAVVRLIVPSYRQPVVGTVILGFVFLSIGLGELVNFGVLFAVGIIVVGLSFLLRGLRR
jgi:hypothetical protein